MKEYEIGSSKLADSKKGGSTSKIEGKGDKFASASSANRRCFECQGFGHIASICPNQKVITILEEFEP